MHIATIEGLRTRLKEILEETKAFNKSHEKISYLKFTKEDLKIEKERNAEMIKLMDELLELERSPPPPYTTRQTVVKSSVTP